MAKTNYMNGVWEHFTVQDGLPDMKIECVFEDHRGRLWIGTHDQGVVCYEGGEFRSFSCREGLSGEGVFSIVEDGQGNLWLGTSRGLTVYDGRKFTRLDMDEPCSFLWGSCRDLQGRLWFGMERQPGRPPMVARWDGNQVEYLALSDHIGEEGQSIHQVVCDSEGTVWLGGEGLFTHTESHGFSEVITPFTGEFVQGLSASSQKMGIWVSTETRLWNYENGEFRVVFTAGRTQGPSSLISDTDRGTWFVTYSGQLFSLKGLECHLVEDLNATVQSNLCLDQSGRLWVGTYGMGLYYYEFSRVTVMREAQGLPADCVLCLAEGRDPGEMWIGTRKGLVRRVDDRLDNENMHRAKDIEITKVLDGRNGKVWLGTRFGRLLSFEKEKRQIRTFTASPMMDNYRIGSLAEDVEGKIWFGFPKGKGFGYCDGERTVSFPPNQDGNYPVWIGAIEVDRQGRVWLGSAAPAQWEGLCCYDGQTFQQVKGFGQSAVLALREDRDGVLWIGTSAGVRWYDGHHFGALNREHGLRCEIVTAIHQDSAGTFWFGTEGGGVCRYDRQVCQVILLPGDQRCNVIHAIHQDRGGQIWLATEGGLVEYTQNRTKPEVAIQEVAADQLYPFPTELQVAGAPADVRIRFQGSSQIYPSSALVYRHRLEGHGTAWQQSRTPWVEYTKLEAGTYIFAVEAVDPDLNYSTAARVRIEVTADPRIEAFNEAVWSSVGQGEFVGISKALQKVLAQVGVVAPSNLSVLVLGETGTGKGMVARAVHEQSSRRDGPFIFVNCGTLHGGLVDSELFGHERGAFTGAVNRKIGKFELAAGGSIFLDEIGDLPMETQVRLLHVIQDRFIERVGGERAFPIDVRIIAATNRDLIKAVAQGQFRADLYFRLNDFTIIVPPLRERLEDLPLLAAYFVRRSAEHLGQPIPLLSRDALAVLTAYEWPGNIRELEHILRRAVIQTRDGDITASQLATDAGAVELGIPPPPEVLPLEEYERRYINLILEKTRGVIYGSQGAAALLGLHPNTLRSRMQKLGVKKPGRENGPQYRDIS